MSVRVAVYARYSSDSQSEASIEDQVRLCRQRIAAEGWNLEQVYRDAAISGASSFRPGYQAMLAAAREGGFDIVLAEALDRLSRDQEDIAGLYKRLKFAGIKLVTLAEGEISELHIGLKGTMNALFLKDLAAKTHRGLRGRVVAGKSAGGLCYGYKALRQTDAHGEPVRGDRAIDEGEAQTITRIFRMFAEGHSPVAIAKALNAEALPGPEGRAWRDTTIRGHAARGTGILRNELVCRPPGVEPHALHQGPDHGQTHLPHEPAGAVGDRGCAASADHRSGAVDPRADAPRQHARGRRGQQSRPPQILGEPPRTAHPHRQGVLRRLRRRHDLGRQTLPRLFRGAEAGHLPQHGGHQAHHAGELGHRRAARQPDAARGRAGIHFRLHGRVEPDRRRGRGAAGP